MSLRLVDRLLTRALPGSWRLAETVLASIADAVMLTDRDGTIVWVNDAFTRMTGYAAEEAVGQTPRLLKSGVQDREHYARLWATILAGRVWRGEIVNRCKDGSLYTAIQTITPIVGDDGEIEHFVAIHADITQLRASEAHLRALFRYALDAIVLFDDEGRLVDANPAVSDLTGYTVDELATLVISDVLPADELEHFARDWTQLTTQGHVRDSCPIRRKDGTTVEIDYQAVAGIVPGVNLLIARDVTEQRRAEAQLERRAAQQSIVARLGQYALTATDAQAVGVEAQRIISEVLPRDAFRTQVLRADADDPGGPEIWRGDEVRIPIGDAATLEVRARGDSHLDEHDHQFLQAVAHVLHAVSERDVAAGRLQHLATHDALTGLPNRALLRDRLEQARGASERSGRGFALLVVGLDGFRVVNDAFGHDVGDQILREAADQLGQVLRPGDTVARLGSDEFALLCADIGSEQDAVVVADRIRRALRAAVPAGASEATLTASVGIVLGDAGTDEASLLRDAEAAMYHAKANGRDTSQLSSSQVQAAALDRLDIAASLRNALDEDRVRVHYQPTIELATGRIVGVEALARLELPDGELMPPGRFIPVAEDTGLVVALGQQVLEQACADAAGWMATDPGFMLSVNVAARQLTRSDIADVVTGAADAAGIPLGSLWLELTETALLDEPTVQTAMSELRQRGVRFAIDDFGTGYSSLAYLRQVPADMLKIDRAFVAGVLDNVQDRALVTATISLARVFGLLTTAEGVETPEQQAHMTGLGCVYAQGYLWSRPVEADRITAMLRDAAASP